MVSDPRAAHQPISEASHVNLSTVPLCNTDSITIPSNNKEAGSVGLILQMLVQEVLRMCGTIYHEHPWEVMPALPLHWETLKRVGKKSRL